jgi:hypothetical protein
MPAKGGLLVRYFSRKGVSDDSSHQDYAEHSGGIPLTPTQAEILQGTSEAWQALMIRQQEIVLQLQEITIAQRELANSWDEAGDPEIAAESRELELRLRGVTQGLLHLEQKALAKVENLVSEVDSALRAR